MEWLLPGAKIAGNCISCLDNGEIKGWPCRFSCSEIVGENLERKQSSFLSSIFHNKFFFGRPKKLNENRSVTQNTFLCVQMHRHTYVSAVFINCHFPALVVKQVSVNAYFAYLNQSLITHLYLKIESLYLMSYPSKNVNAIEPCLWVLLKFISITAFPSFCS